MELEELKTKWKQLDEHVKAQDEKIRELTDSIIEGKAKSPLTALKRHCIVAAIFVPFLLPFFFWTYDFIGLNCPGWHKILLHILTWLFVGFTFVRELYFIYDLKRINISRETATSALRNTIRFRKHFYYGLIIDAILGIVFLSVLWCSIDSRFIFSGIVGGIVGGLIGMKMFRYYVRTIDTLETALREWNEP